ncbi:NUDIX hydrolase [Acanthamoeba polyphaga moumouvirus]|uniref:NUDIX hydrolase n=2 Tax=Moumouvirus TaxID=3080801 RepID=L7RC46_9VIRU|nr:NUDIX hydrolase [Acanthamoeba polyphaga moumouvirus]AGC02099.1 NUDIX hydrolase [Acanthamoeba polyphaga moumouvirus]AQN68471.1 NUDIx hydrolase [Saudi moumouvirus]
MNKNNEKNKFNTNPIILKANASGKTLSIPIKKNSYKNIIYPQTSKSWNGVPYINNVHQREFNVDKNYCRNYDLAYANKPYDAINNCKSAGIIPYTFHNGQLYFLFQKAKNPPRKKDSGWNDFGGKQINPNETTAQIASREFSEETSCLFYLADKKDLKSKEMYDLFKDNQKLNYDMDTIQLLKDIILLSQKYYCDKITEYVFPIYVSSKETYISYFVKVKYIPEQDIPKAEDIHINYEDRYLRDCKWFSLNDIMNLNEKDFHKRLQITRIQQRIMKYYEKGLFT